MSLCPKPGHTVLAGEQATPAVAVQQNWRATSRQPIEVIVELTENNLVLYKETGMPVPVGSRKRKKRTSLPHALLTIY